MDPIYGCRDTDGSMTARSSHPGGVNVGLCDGSVRFVSNGVDPLVWYALFTSNGGEPATLP